MKKNMLKVKIPHEDGTIEEIEIAPNPIIEDDLESDSKLEKIEKRLDELEKAIKELAMIIKKILHGSEYV